MSPGRFSSRWTSTLSREAWPRHRQDLRLLAPKRSKPR
jgi:hypothetical protein